MYEILLSLFFQCIINDIEILTEDNWKKYVKKNVLIIIVMIISAIFEKFQ